MATVTQPAWVAVALPVLGIVVGAGATLAVEVLRGIRNRKADREAREAANEESRRAFQRDTILALQDGVTALANGAQQGYEVDMATLRGRLGIVSAAAWPSELTNQCRLANNDVMKLGVRVADEEARSHLQTFFEAVNRFWTPRNITLTEQLWVTVNESYVELNRKLGTLVREVL
jgi:hypothetical protein